MRDERGAWVLDLLTFAAFVLVALFLLATLGHAQVHPLSVTNCIRPAGGECVQPFQRSPYPEAYVTYLFQSAKATFEAQAVHKLRVRHPEVLGYRFDIGDLSVRYDRVRVDRKAIVEKHPVGATVEDTVTGEEQIVALAGWINAKDLSARLFVLGWVKIWNDQLVEPFPTKCPDFHPECVDLNYMVNLTVANAKFHVGMDRMKVK